VRHSGHRVHQLIAVLLIVAAGLFVIGVASEPDEGDKTVEHSERAEAGETSAEPTEKQSEEGHEERVLGIDVESPASVTAAVVVSLLLAGFLWRRPGRRLLIVVAVVAGGFAVLDVAEVVHQLDEDRTRLAVLATLVAILHAGAAAVALAASGWPPGRDSGRPAAVGADPRRS
jgi:hypothetical protein